jgi:hypothetical protein
LCLSSEVFDKPRSGQESMAQGRMSNLAIGPNP